MKQGLLAQHFKGVAVKRLSAVEINPKKSNQHEFNGKNVFKRLLGTERRKFPARFIWLGEEQEGVSEDGHATWYDARERHPKRTEHRLYYAKNAVTELAREGDALFVAVRTNDSILIVVTAAGSTIESQLLWLFGLPDQAELKFAAHEIAADDQGRLDFAVRYIFDELGIDAEESEIDLLDGMLKKFGRTFPKMKEFSAFARSTLPDVSPLDDVDKAIISWMDREELLFRRLERAIVEDRLRSGFVLTTNVDVEGFNAFSLSVQNRRKARAGAALENHLEHIFLQRGILHGRDCETEDKYRPDFLFPGCAQYRDPTFPAASLTMLGAKSTLKERWRQILSEAARIEEKHLLTLSPGLSTNQTNQMKAGKVRLVVPQGLHETYQPAQRDWLMNLCQFVELVEDRQKRADL